nr:protein IQ-DOMAIN 1-like [Ipomoea batatas]
MGGSGKWIKSLITLNKTHSNNNEGGGKSRKWKLWRSASGGLTMSSGKTGKGGKFMADSEGSESSFVSDNGALAAAMATLVRAPHRDFMMVKQEWAAVRVQTLFRGFLARRALRALRAVVRIQAIFRGRQVRKQAAVTLRCMQALVRVQARIRSQCGQGPIDGQAIEGADPIKQAEKGWCSSPGTVEELKSKLQMKQEGASRRERAMAYAYSQLQPRSNVSSYSRANKRVTPNMIDNNNGEFSWVERWMPTKPWENRLMEDGCSSWMSPISKKSEDYSAGSFSKPPENSPMKIRRNNVSTRISAKEPRSGQLVCTLSDQSSDYPYDDRATTDSTISTPETLGSSINLEEGYSVRPSYMNPTKSVKAKNKQKGSNLSSHPLTKPSSPFRGSTRRQPNTNLYSVNACKDFSVIEQYNDVKSATQIDYTMTEEEELEDGSQHSKDESLIMSVSYDSLLQSVPQTFNPDFEWKRTAPSSLKRRQKWALLFFLGLPLKPPQK